jgi:hypothetical protein
VQLVTVKDAAKEKGISREAIYQAIQNGRLKTRTVLGKIGILRTSLDAYEPDRNKIRAGLTRARFLKSQQHPSHIEGSQT